MVILPSLIFTCCSKVIELLVWPKFELMTISFIKYDVFMYNVLASLEEKSNLVRWKLVGVE